MIESIQAALEALSRVHGADELFSAFRSIRRRVRWARRDDTEAETLGSVVKEAILYRDALKAKGASAQDVDAGLEAVLRARWPKPHDRTVPWRYICEDCGDTGLKVSICRPGMRCNGISTRTDGPGDRPGKYTRLCVGSATYEHDYSEACLCAKGERFRPRQQPKGEDFTAAARSKPKPKTFERWGR